MSSAPTAEPGGAATSDAISIVQRGNYSASDGGSAIQVRLEAFLAKNNPQLLLGDALSPEGY
jgi:hypothetical protein